MALDSGVHAGMTVFSRSVGLVYNDERGAWERWQMSEPWVVKRLNQALQIKF